MTTNPTDEKRLEAIYIDGKAHAVDIDQLMTIDELCFYLQKSRTFIQAMKKAGFMMPRHPVRRMCLSTYSKARKWLERHPDFTVQSIYSKKQDNVRVERSEGKNEYERSE